MYLDAVVVVALVIFSLCWFKRFSKLVYALAAIDIFLRLLNFIANNIGIKGFRRFVNNVFPSSIPTIIGRYSSGVFYNILIWIYIILMVFFLFYTIRACLRKKV